MNDSVVDENAYVDSKGEAEYDEECLSMSMWLSGQIRCSACLLIRYVTAGHVLHNANGRIKVLDFRFIVDRTSVVLIAINNSIKIR